MHALQIKVSGSTGNEGFDIYAPQWAHLREVAARFHVEEKVWNMRLVVQDEDGPDIWGKEGFGDTLAEVFADLMKIRRSIFANARFYFRVVLSDEKSLATLDNGFLSMVAALGAELTISRELDVDSEPWGGH